jgi:hypothetical protein
VIKDESDGGTVTTTGNGNARSVVSTTADDRPVAENENTPVTETTSSTRVIPLEDTKSEKKSINVEVDKSLSCQENEELIGFDEDVVSNGCGVKRQLFTDVSSIDDSCKKSRTY